MEQKKDFLGIIVREGKVVRFCKVFDRILR